MPHHSFFVDGTTYWHVAFARLHVTDALGSSPRELVPQPPELSLAPAIPRLPPPRDSSTSSLQAPEATRQLSNPTDSQPLSLARTRQLYSPTTSSLYAQHSQTAFSGPTATRRLSNPAHSRPSTSSGASQLSSPATSSLPVQQPVDFKPGITR